MGHPNRRALGIERGDGEAPLVPGCSIFVFYLPSTWDDKILFQHFKHCGKIVKATIMFDENKVSRGFGFVTFADSASAHKAIVGMNGFNAEENKKLKVAPK